MHILRYNYPSARSLAPAFGFAGRAWTGFENEVDRLLGDYGQFPVSLTEDKDNVYVRAELPGVSREEVKLEIADGRLTITAERKQKTGEQEEAFTLNRSVEVPEDVQAAKATATHQNGVLTVTLPKREETKPQQIAVG
jgi:HSP20 family protein